MDTGGEFHMSAGKVAYVAAYAIASSAVYVLLLTVYRLLLHPLCKFPGPKAAAASYWYEFYYDVVYGGGGQYFRKLEQMHQRYGPIVRITPNEIHVDDPDWFDVFVGQGGTHCLPSQIREKYETVAKMAGTSLGVFGTSNYHQHRLRRGAISHFFSKQSVRTKAAMLNSKIDKLCKSLEIQAGQDENNVVEIRTSLLAFGTDVICDLALGSSPHGELLMDVDKAKQWRNTIYSVEDLTPIGKQFPSSMAVAKSIPVWLWNMLWPDMGRLMQLHQSMAVVAKNMILKMRNHPSKKTDSRNVFEAILNSALPASEKSYERLVDEGFELISAGGETVARVSSAALFHLLSNPSVLANVQGELKSVSEAGIDAASLRELEALPWLTAVIKESLRIEAIISSRLPLVSPTQEVMYKNWVIPPGTPFSMSPSTILRNPRCFTNPDTFTPERWLLPDELGVAAHKYFVPFSRGARNCIGMNIAYAELYLLLANLISRFDLELYDTIRERDVDHVRDCFVGKPHRSSLGIRVRLCSK